MAYVDGFVLAVPRKRLRDYRKMALAAGKIWKQYGAIDYRECVGDDVGKQHSLGFKKATRLKAGEVVLFSWIVYRSKTDRDRVNKKIMKDPRILAMMDPKDPVFDWKRMVMGGFKSIVSL